MIASVHMCTEHIIVLLWAAVCVGILPAVLARIADPFPTVLADNAMGDQLVINTR